MKTKLIAIIGGLLIGSIISYGVVAYAQGFWYPDSGTLRAVVGTWNIGIHSNAELRLYDNGNYVGFEAPALSADQIWVLPSGDSTGTQYLASDGSGNLSWGSPGGSGDVTGVGDCADGACLDGSSDGGTYIRIYDGDSNYLELNPGNIASDRIVAFRDAAGTVILSGDTFTGEVTATLDSDGSTALTIADSVSVSSWSLTSPTFLTGITATDLIDSAHYVADSIDNEHINWGDIDNLGDEGAITVADTTDTTSWVALWESATGDLAAKSDGALTYNAGTGILTATGFAGALTGNASTATALASDPTDCAANQFAQSIVASGNLTCAAIADADVPDTITINLATLATTLTITDNENTAENNAVIFTSGGALTGGNLGLESDGDFHYNPSTGTVTATAFAGNLTGAVTGNASTATALAGDPTDCGAGDFANAIAASGNLTCGSEADPTVDTEAEIEAITGALFGTSKAVTAGYIWVADGTDFESVAMSSDCTLASGGAITCDHDALDNFLAAEHVDWAGAAAGTIHTDNYIENATHTGDVTGSGALTIGNDKVLEAHLKAVDAAGDEECLTYETTTGDFEWQSCGGTPTVITVADTVDTTSYVALWESATGDLEPKSDAGITYNAGTGTLNSTVITEGGNVVYNSTETPGGELGGTFAFFTIDDGLSVTNWNLTTPTITTGLTTSTPKTLTVAELDRLDGLTSAIIENDAMDASSELLAIMDDETGTGALVFGTSPTFTAQLTVPRIVLNNETIGQSNDDYIDFQGVGGADNTNLRFDLDGTSPTIYSVEDTLITLAEDVVISGRLRVSNASISYDPLFDGLVVYYPGVETTGSTLYDRSQEGNDGTPNGTNLNVDGKFGSGVYADAVNDEIDAGDLGMSEPATVAMWLKPNDTTTYRVYWSQMSGTTAQSGTIAIDVTASDYDIYIWHGSDWAKLIDLDADWSGEWHHLAVTYSSGAVAQAYWDGAPEGSSASAEFDFNGVNFGFFDQAMGQYGAQYAGYADELMIWDRALSADEVRALYRRGAPDTKSAAYTPTNVTTDRSYDADTVAIAELADVVGTLIADLQTAGLLK